MDDDMPFLCPIPKCGKRFTNEDHLNVHSKTHEMSLALNTEKTSSSPAYPFVDQTPTPTKFVKNFEEIGLFQELSKNPFDDAYKKALDSEVAPLPGPQTNELNTPTLIMTDTMRHVSTSVTGNSMFPLTVDRLKSSADKLKPSPLAQKTIMATTTASDVDGKKMGKSLAGKGGSTVLKTPSSSSVVIVTRSKQSDLTSQVADSTSTDVPLDIHNNGDDMMEPDDAEFLRATQSITSPHSTTISTTSSMAKALSMAEKTKRIGSGGKLGPKVKQEAVDEMAATATSPQAQQQCTMQVLLQLPNGQTVPISIPATINNLQVVEDKQQQQEMKPLVLPPQQEQQHQHQLPQAPPLQPAPSKTNKVMAVSAPSSNTTTMALKQRLKAQLQNQLSPTVKSSDNQNLPTSAFMPAAAVPNSNPPVTQMFITHTSSSPIMMMMDSPGSEVNMSDSSEYSFESKRQKMSPDCEDPEERRRKFLERNRAAAARCRQKRKHWIGNLERKADELQNTNLRLQNDVKLLRGEVAHLKTLLLAHKDCPVTQQQRSSGQLRQVLLTETPAAFSNQELAQVVPTGDSLTSDSIQMGRTTILTYLSDRTARGTQAGLSENGKDGMNDMINE